jgi:hypothetical protein
MIAKPRTITTLLHISARPVHAQNLMHTASSAGDLGEAAPVALEGGLFAAKMLPAPHRHVAEGRGELERPAPPARLLGGDDRRARAGEGLVDDRGAGVRQDLGCNERRQATAPACNPSSSTFEVR